MGRILNKRNDLLKSSLSKATIHQPRGKRTRGLELCSERVKDIFLRLRFLFVRFVARDAESHTASCGVQIILPTRNSLKKPESTIRRASLHNVRTTNPYTIRFLLTLARELIARKFVTFASVSTLESSNATFNPWTTNRVSVISLKNIQSTEYRQNPKF